MGILFTLWHSYERTCAEGDYDDMKGSISKGGMW